MVQFKLFNKPCNDLIRVGYSHEKPWKLDLTHSGAGGTFSQSAMPLSGDSIVGIATLKHAGSWGFFSTRLGNQAVGSDLLFKVKSIPSLSFSANLTSNLAQGKSALPFSIDLLANFAPVHSPIVKEKFRVLLPELEVKVNPASSTWNMSSTSGVEINSKTKVQFGGEANGPLDMKYMNMSVGATASHADQGKSWTAAIIAQPQGGEWFKKVLASVHCKSTSAGSPEIGAEFVHTLGSSEIMQMALAGQFYLSQTGGKVTTDTLVKAKLTHDAKIAVALSHKLSDVLTAVIGTQMDAFKPETMKHGLSLKITI